MTSQERLQQIEQVQNRIIFNLAEKGVSPERARSFVEGKVRFTSDFGSGAVSAIKGDDRFDADHVADLAAQLHEELVIQAAHDLAGSEAAKQGKAAGEAAKVETAQKGLAFR